MLWLVLIAGLIMSDVIAKNALKNFDGYEFDSYEDRADDEIVDKIEDLIFGKNDKKRL